jgi:gas vesicle protein
MFELIVGAVLGVLVTALAAEQYGHELRRELRAENDHLRTALRLARTWASHANHPFLVAIIDRALADEAGA